MAAASSTSSSRPPLKCGVPWALLLAIGLLAAFEVGLHRVPLADLVYYGDDTTQRYALRDRAELGLGPDLALIGSSQMRQAVVMPEFIPLARRQLGRSLTVGNYALRGGKMDVMYYLVRALCESKKPPKVIILGVSVRDLRGNEPDWDSIAPFAHWKDIPAELKRNGTGALQMIPTVFRDRVLGWYRTLRFRDYINYLLKTQFVYVRDEGDISLGDTARELTFLTRSLDSSPMSRLTLVRRMGWSFDFAHSPRPAESMVRYLDKIAQECHKRHVKLLVVELPISSILQRALPKKFYSQFQQAMAAFHKRTKVPYLPTTALVPHYSNAQFYDAQHLNYRGAMLFGPKLAEMLPLAK